MLRGASARGPGGYRIHPTVWLTARSARRGDASTARLAFVTGSPILDGSSASRQLPCALAGLQRCYQPVLRRCGALGTLGPARAAGPGD